MLVGIVGWRGMVGSVLIQRMLQEGDFNFFEARFFSTSNAGAKVPEKIKLPDGNILDIIDDFEYLGAYIADSYSDFRRRKGIAWGKFWPLSNIWRATNIPLKLKL